MKTLVNKLCKASSMLFICVLLMGASNCSGIKYESDKGLLAPYQAEVFEYPVEVNGSVCRDMSGKIGACTLIISERQNIKIELLPQAYNYNLRIQCSSSIGFEFEADIQKEKPFKVTISKDEYQDVSNFICIGRITPLDGRNFVSARFELRVRVQDGQYVGRTDGIYSRDRRRASLNMGRFARHIYVYENGKLKTYRERPVVRVGTNPAKIRAYSESELMRYNYYMF